MRSAAADLILLMISGSIDVRSFDARRRLHRLERRADRLVAANRDAILAVTRRLAEKCHLASAEVEAIVRGRLRTRRRRPAWER